MTGPGSAVCYAVTRHPELTLVNLLHMRLIYENPFRCEASDRTPQS